ncbi:helix-turn-helix domain-containing protein [Paenibacillus sp. LMG 31460]|uniref:Helix-turn-helix domain-containing protein n=1 Tax=Paenibacillus germinis TaxID=2654979 RepID=A0ABX1Z6C1_9BACL|nr:helix-turn-helix domain-containing protein [Paenibacillus germinis]NOU88841.1 helix-turn-helix domain-containing protein [Paenibacillus germinis]
MKVMNYLNLNQHPAHLQFYRNRTNAFAEIYHAHQGMEILIVHEGTGTVIVEQQIFDLAPGMLFYFRPFQLHRIRMNELAQQAYIRSFFVFEPALLDSCLGAFPSTREFFQKLWKDPLSIQKISGLDTEALHNLLQAHHQTIEHAKPEHLLEEQLFFLTNLMHHLKTSYPLTGYNLSTERNSKVKSSSIAEKVMEWIELHYMEPFELNQLAQAIHLSPNHISAVFKQIVGSSITEYLTARRIRQACLLLKTSDISIQGIGQAVGLGNFSYFCQMFKKHVGLTPYQFKSTSDQP